MEHEEQAETPTDAEQTLAEAGELAALARILPRLPQGASTLVGPGDDAAVVAASDGRVVVTTDTMLEGPDFQRAWSSWHDLGVKAAATNLADVAAMGATPTGLVVALAVPPTTLVTELEAFATGLADAVLAMAPGCGVVGGDLGTAQHAVIAVTAFGDLGHRAPVLRSGARPGDRVVVVGRLGLAATGLRLLFAEAMDVTGVPSGSRARRLREREPEAIAAQVAPTPPIAAGPLLAELGATAMLDVSDGLALDAARIARASGVVLALSAAAVEAAAPGATLDAALVGGEDHALLATVPAEIELPATLAGHPVHVLGTVRAVASGGTPDGAAPGVLLDDAPLEPSGWDPYRH